MYFQFSITLQMDILGKEIQDFALNFSGTGIFH